MTEEAQALIAALRRLADEICSGDGSARALILRAAGRLSELEKQACSPRRLDDEDQHSHLHI
jgi:hypothetical protein